MRTPSSRGLHSLLNEVYLKSEIMNLSAKIKRFLQDESGPTAVEYAIMLALIMAVCITAIGAMGLATADSWSDSSSKMDAAINATN